MKLEVGQYFIVDVINDNNFDKDEIVLIKSIGEDEGEFTTYLVSNRYSDSFYFAETILKDFKPI